MPQGAEDDTYLCMSYSCELLSDTSCWWYHHSSVLTHPSTGVAHIWDTLNSATAQTRKSSLIDGPLSCVTLIMESLDFHRTCPGVPLEQYGPFPTSTQNGMPWSSSQRWRRKVERSDLLSHHRWTIPAVLTLNSTAADTVPVVRVLANRSNAQRQVIAKTFGEIAQKVTHLAQFNVTYTEE